MPDDDEIGYRKPPRRTQFGQPQANRRGPGRRKGSKNVATIFAAATTARINARDGSGAARKMTKIEAALTQLANKAASGDLRAINMVIILAQTLEARDEHNQAPDVVLSEADRKVIGHMAERIKKQFEGGEHD